MVRIGELLSEERIDRLKEQDGLEVAYQRALELISYRPRSEKEIRQRLAEKGYTKIRLKRYWKTAFSRAW